MDKMKMESVDMTTQNIDKIGLMFPNCITETIDEKGKPKKAINFELLKQMLSSDVLEGDEAYEFTWVGKKASIIEANKPIRKTLRPCKEESKNWDTTENLYIEGDNLDVLKLLQESYLGKVKMIYIDPPYNTGNDFIYNDDFKMTSEEYEDELGTTDDDGNRMFKNTDTNGRFHSDWCSMIYSRLNLSRNLLTDDGVIFISIDDNEVENLKKICNEIFGESNFVAQMVWQTTPGSNTGTNIITVTEHILVYSKNNNYCKFNTIVIGDDSKYILSDKYESKRGKYILNKLDRRMTGVHYSDALNYPIKMPDGQLIYPGSTDFKNNEGWNYRWSKTKLEWGTENDFVVFKNVDGKWNAYFKQYFKVDNNDTPIVRSLPYQNLITLSQFNSTQGTKEIMNIFGKKYFDYPKPSQFIKHILKICENPNDIILDFFSGSATTAHSVMQLNAEDGGNRKFIMVQLPEVTDEKSEAYKAGYKNICEIGKERIRRAGDKIASEIEENNSQLKLDETPKSIPDTGFRVLKLDTTNMKDVYYSADEYDQTMLSMFESNVKADRTDLDLLFSCLLEWGLPLSMTYFSEQIEDYTVHTYNDGDLIACFDENVADSVIKIIAKRQPLRAVFRDSSFANSPAKLSVTEKFKQLAPDTRVKII